jgi:hypothetical protein
MLSKRGLKNVNIISPGISILDAPLYFNCPSFSVLYLFTNSDNDCEDRSSPI